MVLVAAVVGGLSGAASVGLIAMIREALRDPGGGAAWLPGLFTALCGLVLLTKIVSQVLLTRLAQDSISRLLLTLCDRILAAPLRGLETIGAHRVLASLTTDVTVISQVIHGLPVLCVNVIILVCGMLYLGWLSFSVLLCAVAFALFGAGSYWVSARLARRYLKRGRDAQDGLIKQLRKMILGIKELKTHHERRQAFMKQVRQANRLVRENQFVGISIQAAAVSWGRLMFFVAIGLLLFLWPRWDQVDAPTLTGYTITVLYLMTPLERIMAWLPLMTRANISLNKINQLGLAFDRELTLRSDTPIDRFERLELIGVKHTYDTQGDNRGFSLGPLDLTLEPGEVVILVGGNGSGKTTLAKLVAGLYVPGGGEIRLDGRAITDQNREDYRQLFSVVFATPVLFESLLGLESPRLDEQARSYLSNLELAEHVDVVDGVLSTTALSKGQRKRLALLTAYLEDRPIYVFDEWAADQDPLFKKVFYHEILPELRKRGKAVLVVSHDDRYFATADRLIRLEDGRAVSGCDHERTAFVPSET